MSLRITTAIKRSAFNKCLKSLKLNEACYILEHLNSERAVTLCTARDTVTRVDVRML